MVELLGNAVEVIAYLRLSAACEVITVNVYSLGGATRNVPLFLRTEKNVLAGRSAVNSLLTERNGEDKLLRLNEGAVHTENDGEIAGVDVLDNVALGKSALVERVGHPDLAHKGEALVDLIVNELHGNLVLLMLNEREGTGVDEAVNVALRPILVERKGVIVALKGELCEVRAVSGEEDRRALQIGVYVKLSLVGQRNENVSALVAKRYNVTAKARAGNSLPIAVGYRNNVFNAHK